MFNRKWIMVISFLSFSMLSSAADYNVGKVRAVHMKASSFPDLAPSGTYGIKFNKTFKIKSGLNHSPIIQGKRCDIRPSKAYHSSGSAYEASDTYNLRKTHDEFMVYIAFTFKNNFLSPSSLILTCNKINNENFFEDVKLTLRDIENDLGNKVKFYRN